MVDRQSYHHVDVRGTHWVTVKKLEELVCWTVLWERVGGWAETDESVLSLVVGLELSSQVVVALVVWVLEIVLSVGGCLPDVDAHIWKRLFGGHVGDDSVHECDKTAWRGVLDDRGVKFSPWCVGAPEWTENGCRCWGIASVGGDVVCDFSHETNTDVRSCQLKLDCLQTYDSRPTMSEIR